MAKFSIIIPCFNCENTLIRAIDSVLNQTYPDYQLVLVDDGSVDNTAKLCDEYVNEHDNVVVIHQKNAGLMRAWKNGVLESSGEYIIFCDADDYIDTDALERIETIVADHHPSLILYGMYEEYDNGDKIRVVNRLEEGAYDREKIDKIILPQLFSDGGMQSEAMCKSRCCKAFYRQTLVDIIDILSDNVSLGEDDITTFACVLNSDLIYCMGDYCPYHYIRNADSMIGKYDTKAFDKIEVLYGEIEKLAKKYNYRYYEQILSDRLSTTILFMKKEICRNPNGYKDIANKLAKVRDSEEFIECITKCSVKQYSLFARLFAMFMIKRMYFCGYIAVRGYEKIRGRNT